MAISDQYFTLTHRIRPKHIHALEHAVPPRQRVANLNTPPVCSNRMRNPNYILMAFLSYQHRGIFACTRTRLSFQPFLSLCGFTWCDQSFHAQCSYKHDHIHFYCTLSKVKWLKISHLKNLQQLALHSLIFLFFINN